MRLLRFGLWFWLLAVAVGWPLQAAAQVAQEANFPVQALTSSAPSRIEVGARMGVLVDPTGTLSIEQVQSPAQAWQRIDRQSPNFGFTHDSYWFRFQIDNRDAQTLARFIELPIPYLEDVQLYHYVGGVLQIHYTLGAQSPFAQRVVRHPNFIMPVQLVPGINQIYLRLASAGTIEAPLRIWDPVRFYAASNDENLAQGSVIGVLLVMVIYNLFVFFSTRDINYIYYIGFVASYLMFHLSLTGYAFAYVWPQAVRWNSFAISTFVASSAFFTCLFTENFLRLRSFSKPAFYLVRSLSWFYALLLLVTFVLPYSWTIRVGASVAIPTAAIALFLGYWRWLRGAKFARFYCLAWTAILIGLAVLSASKQGWIAFNGWTENASQIGIILLVVLLSFTLADRINNDRTLRLNAQAVALGHERSARASQQALIQATEHANRELEQRVASRTNDLNATLEQLKSANDRLQLLSTTDRLTQIGNRAFFDTSIASELRRATRQGTPLTVMMLDIDHFKRVNDTHGHLAGDACLRALADLLRTRIHRAGDILARYGGEEFVIVLSATSMAQSLHMAEELRAAIESMEIRFEEKLLRITASFGVVCAVPHPTQTVQNFLAAADHALYEAKGAGRNCVRTATLG